MDDIQVRIRRDAEVKKSEAEIRALLLLSGITFDRIDPTINAYDSERFDPWWIVRMTLPDTDGGLPKGIGNLLIGWRKRVLDIDWCDFGFKCVVTQDDVTKSETHVHAWSYSKAIEYLMELKRQFLIARRDALRALGSPP